MSGLSNAQAALFAAVQNAAGQDWHAKNPTRIKEEAEDYELWLNSTPQRRNWPETTTRMVSPDA